MKSKNMKVAYSTRYPPKGACTVPKIQMEGKWLESLGFFVGSTVIVEYEEGSIRIRPLSEEELVLKEHNELQAQLRMLRHVQIRMKDILFLTGMEMLCIH